MRANSLAGKRVAIVGSRDFRELAAVDRYVAKLPPSAVVVSGGAAGVDSRAVTAARKRGLTTVEYKANWATHGKRAGILRNSEIVAAADVVVAFWDGTSPGTKDTIRKALKAAKPVAVYARLQDRGAVIWIRDAVKA